MDWQFDDEGEIEPHTSLVTVNVSREQSQGQPPEEANSMSALRSPETDGNYSDEFDDDNDSGDDDDVFEGQIEALGTTVHRPKSAMRVTIDGQTVCIECCKHACKAFHRCPSV